MSIEARFRVALGEFTLDADVQIPSSGVSAIFGASGTGKTTLLRAIAGLDRHPGGFLKVDDAVWQDADAFVPTYKRPIGYVFQEPSLFQHLTVRRNLEYGRKRLPESDRRVSLDRMIDLLGLGRLLDRKPEGLSGGERQRVAVARSLAVSPRLLLMDEPLASLDQNLKLEFLPYLESLHSELEIPVIYVSHAQDEVARLADHLVLIDDGRILGSGPIDEMLTRLDLPLALGQDAEAMVEAMVAGHDDEFHLTHLDFPGGRFTVLRKELPLGATVRVRVAARDVSLTLERQAGTSILNIFAAAVEEIVEDGPAQVAVRLSVEGVPLLARVTRKSAKALDLQPGKRVFAQAKSVAVLS